MTWEKLGNVFCPEGQSTWMHSHAALPVAERLVGDNYRIYFSCRDRENKSSVGWAEISLRQPQRVLAISDKPVLAPGELGTYDDSGVSIGCLVKDGERRRLYYMGWNLSVTVPWRNSIGLAISDAPGAPFRKVSRAPIMDRHDADPFSLSYPWVLKQGTGWRMWYGSHTAWGKSTEEMRAGIKIAESPDGVGWDRRGIPAILPNETDGKAMSRPCVVAENGIYKMWFSVRTGEYRMGYAESPDGIVWTRREIQPGIEASPSGWDSEAICYPYVFDHDGKKYLLYCGNGYGKTGFGLAVMK